MTNGRLDWAFIIRLLVAGLLIYFAVWRENKIALTIILALVTLALELYAFIIDIVWRRP